MRRQDREVTDMHGITEILDRCRTASVAMLDGDKPYVVPLSYGYERKGSSLIFYFHCAREGKKADLLKQNNRVCFTIFEEGELLRAEAPCGWGYAYSSVVGTGVVEFLEDSAEKRAALQKIFALQTGTTVEFTEAQAASVCVFRICSEDYTGKHRCTVTG